MSESRVVEDDFRLVAMTRPYHAPIYLTVRPTLGNGAVLKSSVVKGAIQLTVDERKRLAMALWPDAFNDQQP